MAVSLLAFGKETWMGLGPYPDVTLSEARDLATRERKKVRQGIDPLTDKRARQIAARTAHENMLTFAECAELYIESQAPGWSNPKHIEQWRSTLTKLPGPIIGHLPGPDRHGAHHALYRTDLGNEDGDGKPPAWAH